MHLYTFENYLQLVEKKVPENVQDILTDLEDDDVKILDYVVKKKGKIETHSIFLKRNNGDYEVIEVTDGDDVTRKMDSAELRRYKTGD